MDTYAEQLLRRIDFLNAEIARIKNEEKSIYDKLSAYKRKIEQDNAHYIGKKAMVVHYENETPMLCECTAVIANDDYKTVRPLFKRNGKKYIYITYEWV
jgi:hypothetical protein